MKDICGRDLQVGDRVVTTLGERTSVLEVCTIVAFTEGKVKLSWHPLEIVYKYPKQICRTMEECDA